MDLTAGAAQSHRGPLGAKGGEGVSSIERGGGDEHTTHTHKKKKTTQHKLAANHDAVVQVNTLICLLDGSSTGSRMSVYITGSVQ